MTERYWAPQRATVEPDAVVLAMLEPGDIGSSVLAVHRAGAAAIDTVVKAPLPSEAKLVDVMGRVRSAVADKVVDSVAKSASPSYAGLFVMDVFDDAEEGALSIYRSAVAKGVAPPVAAQRAADIFGVPAKLMGKYAVMATDPRANPVAVRDLADRVLLEHVSHVVKVEQPQEEVSKANGDDEGAQQEAPRARRAWRESDVLRDALGRFADEPGNEPPPGSLEAIRRELRLTGTPSQVAGEALRPDRAQRQERRTRTTRQTRVTRAVPTGEQRQRAAAQRPQAQRAAAQRPQAGREQARRQAAARQAISREVLSPGAAKARTLNEQRSKELVHVPPMGDVLNRIGSIHNDMSYYDLDTPIVLRTDLGSGSKFRDAVRNQAGRFKNTNEMIFRLGYLMQAATANSTAEAPGSRQDEINRETLGQNLLREADTIDPIVSSVNVTDLSMTRASEQEFVNEVKDQISSDTNEAWFTGDKNGVDESDYIQPMPVYRPYGEDDYSEDVLGQWAIVHYRPPDPNLPHVRPMPMMEEFVIHGAPRGAYETGVKHGLTELDPNQIVRVIYNPDLDDDAKTGLREETFWDDQNQIAVNRWHLEVISEEELGDYLWNDPNVGKADDEQYARGPRRARAWRESDVVRDALGRFADEPEDAQEQAPQRQERQVRRVRATRVGRSERAVSTRQAATRESAQRQSAQRDTARRDEAERSPLARAFQRKAAERITGQLAVDEVAPVLFDQNDFKVFTQHQWNEALNLLDEDDELQLFSHQEVRLDPVTRRALAESTVHNVYGLAKQMAANVDDDPNLRPSEAQRVFTHMPIPEHDVVEKVAARIESFFDEHPTVDKLELYRTGDTLRFVGNLKPAGHQNIVEVNPDIDWDKPVYLRYVGRWRARRFGVRDIADQIESLIRPTTKSGLATVVANPEVHLYRISTRHYRADNQ